VPKAPPIKKNKKAEVGEDLWATAPEISKLKQRALDYLRSTKDNIARVVKPLSGQSYNPSALAH
jgi:hypothetical protein